MSPATKEKSQRAALLFKTQQPVETQGFTRFLHSQVVGCTHLHTLLNAHAQMCDAGERTVGGQEGVGW